MMLAIIALAFSLHELKQVDPDWNVIKAVQLIKKLTHKQFFAYSWVEHM
jgi:hypothetical protein